MPRPRNSTAALNPVEVRVIHTEEDKAPTVVDGMRIRGSIAVEDMPAPLGRKRDARAWQALSEQIIDVSSRGRALVIEVPVGRSAEAIRTSLSTELKRQKYRLVTRRIKNDDETQTLYCFGTPLDADSTEESSG
jgi:hypothetical protein